MRVEQLRRRAEAHGVASRFRMADGRWREVAPETLTAVLEAMGAGSGPRPSAAFPPVVVARRGHQAGWAP
ncbi:MAG TPA: hypothetical protein VFA46_24030, partial [Actinomycetes bacterium]|nr:hypothetical protein [Actinomycetes bacterium]